MPAATRVRRSLARALPQSQGRGQHPNSAHQLSEFRELARPRACNAARSGLTLTDAGPGGLQLLAISVPSGHAECASGPWPQIGAAPEQPVPHARRHTSGYASRAGPSFAGSCLGGVGISQQWHRLRELGFCRVPIRLARGISRVSDLPDLHIVESQAADASRLGTELLLVSRWASACQYQ